MLNTPATSLKVGLLNPSFKYYTAANTDIRRTFERVRAEQARENLKTVLKENSK